MPALPAVAALIFTCASGSEKIMYVLRKNTDLYCLHGRRLAELEAEGLRQQAVARSEPRPPSPATASRAQQQARDRLQTFEHLVRRLTHENQAQKQELDALKQSLDQVYTSNTSCILISRPQESRLKYRGCNHPRKPQRSSSLARSETSQSSRLIFRNRKISR